MTAWVRKVQSTDDAGGEECFRVFPMNHLLAFTLPARLLKMFTLFAPIKSCLDLEARCKQFDSESVTSPTKTALPCIRWFDMQGPDTAKCVLGWRGEREAR